MKKLSPVHYSERIRQILYLVAYLVIFELATPKPFIQSSWGKMVYLGILFYIVKGVVRWRQERSGRFYAKTQKLKARWEKRKFGLSDFTRFRIQRIIRFMLIAFTVGWMIDGASAQCEGAINCAAAIPTLITSNLGELIQFTLRIMISMSTLFGTMYLLARLDLYTLILPESIITRFDDVYGQDKAVESVREALMILNKPDEVEARGGYMPSGILLSGPPGVGKSYLAEAAAGEAGKPFVSVDGSSFTSMWMGVPLMKVKMIFKQLRMFSVKYGGVVVFFDEIDTLGSRGGGVISEFINKMLSKTTNHTTFGGGGGSGALQMMLTEMSGLSKPKGIYNKVRVFLGFKPIPPPKYRILWLAATNLPEALDPAMLRPGRFDRKIHMGYPQVQGRIATLNGYLTRVNNDITPEQVEKLARENPRATGASIKDAVNEALLSAIRHDREVVSFDDMRDVILMKMMGEVEGEMEDPDDQWRTAVHEAAHAVMSHHVRPEAPIQFASVHKRGKTGGFVNSVDDVDRYKTKQRMVADIMVCLASTWAEKYYFEDNVSTGPSSDLEKATNIATAMWSKFAMGNYVMVFKDEQIPSSMYEEIRDWLHAVYENVDEFMLAHRDEVELVAQLLQQYGTVDGAEIHDLIGRLEQ